jgi:predicted anti-sigma-YlaC factor YlaD
MDCKNTSTQLLDLINGELATEDRQAIERHLAGCPACRKQLATLRACWEALGEDPGLEVPAGFAARFWRRVHVRRWARFAAAAAAVIAVGGSLLYYQHASRYAIGPGVTEQIEQPQDLEVISDLDVLQDLDVIQALVKQGNGKESNT